MVQRTTRITDLPPELLMVVFTFSGTGRAHYNDRERQHDLTIFARVCQAWACPAQALLFGSPAPANPGRASLLGDVLARRPDLAATARRFTWTARNGQADGTLVNNLLRACSNLEQVEIGADHLQHSDIAASIAATLATLPLTSFTCGLRRSFMMTQLLELLRGLVSLKYLDLYDWLDRDKVDADSCRKKDGPPPTYRLTTLKLRPLDELWPARFQWLLGATSSLSTLHLELDCVGLPGDVSWHSPIVAAVAEVVVANAADMTSLELILRRPTPSRAPTTRDMSARMAPNNMLAQLVVPNVQRLQNLTLGGFCDTETPFLLDYTSDTLERIELLDAQTGQSVADAILDERLPALRELCVVNMPRSDGLAKTLAWHCSARDVRLTFERRFEEQVHGYRIDTARSSYT